MRGQGSGVRRQGSGVRGQGSGVRGQGAGDWGLGKMRWVAPVLRLESALPLNPDPSRWPLNPDPSGEAWLLVTFEDLEVFCRFLRSSTKWHSILAHLYTEDVEII